MYYLRKSAALLLVLVLAGSLAHAQMAPIDVSHIPYPFRDSAKIMLNHSITDNNIYFVFPSDTTAASGLDVYSYSSLKDETKKLHTIPKPGWGDKFVAVKNQVFYGYNGQTDASVRLAEFKAQVRNKVHASTLELEYASRFVAGDNKTLYFYAQGRPGKGVYAYNASNGQFRTVYILQANEYLYVLKTIGDDVIFSTSTNKVYVGSNFGQLNLVSSTEPFTRAYKHGDEVFLGYRDKYKVYKKGSSSLVYGKNLNDQRIWSVDSCENGLFFSTSKGSTMNVYKASNEPDSFDLLTQVTADNLLSRNVYALNKDAICMFLKGGKILIHNFKTDSTITKTYPDTLIATLSTIRTPVTDINKGTLYFLSPSANGTMARLCALSNNGNKLEVISDPFSVGFLGSPKDLFLLKNDIYFFNATSKGLFLKKFVKDIFFVKFNCFNDLNKNGTRDNNEPAINKLNFDIDEILTNLQSRVNGSLNLTIEREKHKIKPEALVNWYFTTDSIIDIEPSDGKSRDTLTYNIGLAPFKDQYEIDGTASWLPTRCGFNTWFRPKLINSGTKSFTGEMRLLVDTIITIDSFDIAPDSTFGNEFVWVFNSVDPTHFKAARAYFRVPRVQFLGRKIKFDLTFKGHGSNNEQFSRLDTLRPEINCSYDPNDKSVTPNRKDLGNQTLHSERLTYRIRFQNTGTDTAFNIVIEDTLSQYLDWGTFKLLDYSHQVETKFYDDGLVAFHFNDVMLPDSHINEAQSHGYVSYSIKARPGLDEWTEIKNTAHIYFDFNPAIVTNTTKNAMVKEITYQNARKPETSDALFLFPNPVKNRLNLELDGFALEAVSVLSVNGQQVLNDSDITNGQLVVSSLEPGLYFISIVQGQKVLRASFVKL